MHNFAMNESLANLDANVTVLAYPYRKIRKAFGFKLKTLLRMSVQSRV